MERLRRLTAHRVPSFARNTRTDSTGTFTSRRSSSSVTTIAALNSASAEMVVVARIASDCSGIVDNHRRFAEEGWASASGIRARSLESAGARPSSGESSAAIRTFASSTAHNHLRERGLVRCCASTGRRMASSSSIRFLAQRGSRTSRPRSRRSDSSMTWLAPFSSRAARTLTPE